MLLAIDAVAAHMVSTARAVDAPAERFDLVIGEFETRSTSGLSRDPRNPPTMPFWSAADNKGQGIRCSVDRGRTWTMYAGTTIFARPERDPKVFRYAPEKHGVTLLDGGALRVAQDGELRDVRAKVERSRPASS